jgi:hypothetical protein
MNEEILELIDLHRDRGLSPEEQARLHELLKEDPGARRTFVREQMLEAAFHLETSGSTDAMRSPEKVVQARRFAPARFARWAAAAVLIFSIGMGLGGTLKKKGFPATAAEEEPVDDGVALVTQVVDAVWTGERQPRADSILSAGRLQLESGLVQIEFYSGARLILDGKVDLELVSANQAICHSGRLRALVPPQARGFSVTAPQFKLIDLGTEFGMEIVDNGASKVQVFDGEVELHSSDQVHRILGGNGLSWATSGEKADIPADPKSFPTFDDVRDRTKERSSQRYAAWQEWNRSLEGDPRIAVRYDFESDSPTLTDSGGNGAHGLIIGCERSNGRWAEKGALEFKRPGDRVRVDIPGSYESLTLTAWIRVDANPGRQQGLLLTDGYEEGHPHWQIAPTGELRLGLRIPSLSKRMMATGYGSPVLFTPRQMGVWSFVATVYDRAENTVLHYFNGREVSSEKIQFDQALQFGPADIGNWGVPFGKDRHPVRNFVGRMDELTLWNSALKGDELQEIYRQTRP